MIRSFQSQDAQACSDLIRACIEQDAQLPSETTKLLLREETPALMRERARLFYLAVYDLENLVVGCGGLELNEIRLLYVAPDHHGEGIGRALLAHLESMVPPALFSDIFVYSTLRAEGFYLQLGYRSKGRHLFSLKGKPLPTMFMVKPTKA